MTTNRKPKINRPRKTSRDGLVKNGSIDQVAAARIRVETCERFGMTVDPRDLEIIANGGR